MEIKTNIIFPFQGNLLSSSFTLPISVILRSCSHSLTVKIGSLAYIFFIWTFFYLTLSNHWTAWQGETESIFYLPFPPPSQTLKVLARQLLQRAHLNPEIVTGLEPGMTGYQESLESCNIAAISRTHFCKNTFWGMLFQIQQPWYPETFPQPAILMSKWEKAYPGILEIFKMELTVLKMLIFIAKDPILDVYRCHGYAMSKL